MRHMEKSVSVEADVTETGASQHELVLDEAGCSFYGARKRKRPVPVKLERPALENGVSEVGSAGPETRTKSTFEGSDGECSGDGDDQDEEEQEEAYEPSAKEDTPSESDDDPDFARETSRRLKKTKRKRAPTTMKKRKKKKDEEEVEEEGDVRKSRTSEYQAEKKRQWRMRQPYLKCPHCSYRTKDKDTYGSHIAKHDPNVERFVCHTCSKTFRNKRSFRCHMRSHGSPEKLHQCAHCPFKTPSKINWLQHLAVKHKVDAVGNALMETYSCGECGYKCMAEYQLKAHVIRRHQLDKPFKCQQCPYSSHIKFELEKHVNIKHLNIRNFICECCGATSQTKSGLERHKRTHTPGVKPYKCTICGTAYADNRKLKSHLARHENNEKPFACPLCSHSCHRRDNLQMHLKRIHKTTLEASVRTDVRVEVAAPPTDPSPDPDVAIPRDAAEGYGMRQRISEFLQTSEFLKYEAECEVVRLESANA